MLRRHSFRTDDENDIFHPPNSTDMDTRKPAPAFLSASPNFHHKGLSPNLFDAPVVGPHEVAPSLRSGDAVIPSCSCHRRQLVMVALQSAAPLLHLKLAHQTPRGGGRKRWIEDLAPAGPRSFSSVMNAQFNRIDNEEREREERRRKEERKMYPSHRRQNATPPTEYIFCCPTAIIFFPGFRRAGDPPLAGGRRAAPPVIESAGQLRRRSVSAE